MATLIVNLSFGAICKAAVLPDLSSNAMDISAFGNKIDGTSGFYLLNDKSCILICLFSMLIPQVTENPSAGKLPLLRISNSIF